MSIPERRLNLWPVGRSLFVTFASLAFGLLVLSIVALNLFGFPSTNASRPLTVSEFLDILRFTFTLIGGVGAAVGLVMIYRRQRLAEFSAHVMEYDATERRITDLYTKAVDQLGSDKAAVRLGAIYGLERLAQNYREHRQTIVEVICAYLRMPYTSFEDAVAAQMQAPLGTTGATVSQGEAPLATRPSEGPIEEIETDPRQEHQVRLAAQDVLQRHLAQLPRIHDADSKAGRDSPEFWPDIGLNLAGASLVNFDLSHSRCAYADFSGAKFYGPAHFESARFMGWAGFNDATFHDLANFNNAAFRGDTGFNRAVFNFVASFSRAIFHGVAGFGEASFRHNTWFEDATFNAMAAFHHGSFQGDAWFRGATFLGGLGFHDATLGGDGWFGGTEYEGVADFHHTDFRGSVEFIEAVFHGQCTFNDVTFHNEIEFERTIFEGDTDFNNVITHSVVSFSEGRVAVGAAAPEIWPAGWHLSPKAPESSDHGWRYLLRLPAAPATPAAEDLAGEQDSDRSLPSDAESNTLEAEGSE